MQRIAIIDIGSNSARLVISHIYKNGSYHMVYTQKETLRLAQKVNSDNLLTEEAFSGTINTMRSFVQMCQLYKVDKTIAVATAAIRNSENGAELVQRVAEETGLQLHILSGNAEAYISYLGVINTIAQEDGIIFDLGGGSTELILFHDRKIVHSISIPFGAVNITNIFHSRNTMTPDAYSSLSFFLSTQLSQQTWLKQKGLPLIGVGGTARAVAKIIQREKKYPATKLHNYSYSAQLFRSFFNKIRKTDFAGRSKIPGLSQERNDLILAGCAIINCLLETTGCKTIITSGCGLREGLFYDYYFKFHNMPLIAENILEHSRNNVLGLTGLNIGHAQRVKELAMSMFRAWQELHQLPQSYEPLLETAAVLHDIGIAINYYSHQRHSAYMVQNAMLFGLTHREQMMTSAIAGWHNGVSKNYYRTKFYMELLNDDDWLVVNKLSCFLALAEAMDVTETALVTSLKPTLTKGKAHLLIEVKAPLHVELALLNKHSGWFKKIFGVPLSIDTQLRSLAEKS